jgi:hypothetical protein
MTHSQVMMRPSRRARRSASSVIKSRTTDLSTAVVTR